MDAPHTRTVLPRILVVDDNEALRENLAEALQLEGYEVAMAPDGMKALDLLASDPSFGIVLVDLRMPGLDGREVVERIRKDPRLAGVRVVLTTGYTGPRARVGIEADAFLTKPFGVRELLAAIHRVVAA